MHLLLSAALNALSTSTGESVPEHIVATFCGAAAVTYGQPRESSSGQARGPRRTPEGQRHGCQTMAHLARKVPQSCQRQRSEAL